MDRLPYALEIGSIVNAMLDIAYALNITNQFLANPSECHQIVVKIILKYLKRAMDAFQSIEKPNSKLRVIVMLAFNPVIMIANFKVAMCFIQNCSTVNWKQFQTLEDSEFYNPSQIKLFKEHMVGHLSTHLSLIRGYEQSTNTLEIQTKSSSKATQAYDQTPSALAPICKSNFSKRSNQVDQTLIPSKIGGDLPK